MLFLRSWCSRNSATSRPDERGNCSVNEQPVYTEMGFDGVFNFTCGRHVSCFLDCCTGTRIWLYPYDVLRISRYLGLSPSEFFQSYCKFYEPDEAGFPVLLFRSADNGQGRCPFVREDGCAIYPERPWICRLFPVIPVECRTDLTPEAERRFNVLVWEGCRGIGCGQAVTIGEWWRRADIFTYEEAYLPWQRLLEGLKGSGRLPLTGEGEEQFILGSYDPDRFREKLLAGEFRNVLGLEQEELERAGSDDLFLMEVACRWLEKVLVIST